MEQGKLNSSEAAKILKCSPDRLIEYARKGRIKGAIKVDSRWTFTRKSIDNANKLFEDIKNKYGKETG